MWGLLAAFSLGVYLAISHFYFRMGFPLDDAWIHLTYARSLGVNREWAYLPGQPSAGSTAPLWTALLALGFPLGLAPYAWTYFLGGLCLALLGWMAMVTWERLCPTKPGWAAWMGVLVIFEWHLVWSAGSGMETAFFSLIVLLVLTSLMQDNIRWLVVGLLAGASIWIRPDGLTLAGPALMVGFLRALHWKREETNSNIGNGTSSRQRILATLDWKALAKAILPFVSGVIICLVPYLVINQVLAGSWWPNTFFAKQAEYGVQRQVPFITRLLTQVSLPLVGAGSLLVPGFLIQVFLSLNKQRWGHFAAAAWVVAYLTLYAWRLPVTYQHGRYIIPVIPVFLLLGLSGLAHWLEPADHRFLHRLIARTWLVSIAAVLLLFWGIGGRAYARDVAIIETEMVTVAHWIEENVGQDDLVAAHDIGAIGYFANRPLLDLAGLVSPEVIPFIRDEVQLASYLDRRGAGYLVTFPGWYPQLVQQSQAIYYSGGKYSRELGGENMVIYRWLGQ